MIHESAEGGAPHGVDALAAGTFLPGLAALPGDDPHARRRLPARVVTYWRLRSGLAGIVVVGLAVLGAVRLDWFTPTARWIIVGNAALWFFGIGGIVGPPLRRRLFWYSMSPTEIDLQHGWVVRTRTVVPMSRVQHLKSEQGLLGRRFALADLHIHTAAGAVVVKGLDQSEADLIRSRISVLAGLADDT